MKVRRGLEQVVETLSDVNRAVSTFSPVSREQFMPWLSLMRRATIAKPEERAENQ